MVNWDFGMLWIELMDGMMFGYVRNVSLTLETGLYCQNLSFESIWVGIGWRTCFWPILYQMSRRDIPLVAPWSCRAVTSLLSRRDRPSFSSKILGSSRPFQNVLLWPYWSSTQDTTLVQSRGSFSETKFEILTQTIYTYSCNFQTVTPFLTYDLSLEPYESLLSYGIVHFV